MHQEARDKYYDINDRDFALYLRQFLNCPGLKDKDDEFYANLICILWMEQNETMLAELLNYLESTWIRQLLRANIRDPLFLCKCGTALT